MFASLIIMKRVSLEIVHLFIFKLVTPQLHTAPLQCRDAYLEEGLDLHV